MSGLLLSSIKGATIPHTKPVKDSGREKDKGVHWHSFIGYFVLKMLFLRRFELYHYRTVVRSYANEVVTNCVGLFDSRVELLGAVDIVDTCLASSRRLELRLSASLLLRRCVEQGGRLIVSRFRILLLSL